MAFLPALFNDVAIGSGFVTELDFLNLGIGSFPLNVALACVFCACSPLRAPHVSIQWDFIEQCGELTYSTHLPIRDPFSGFCLSFLEVGLGF